MIRCRQCNSELIEQARFCNVCGLPQDPQEPEKPTQTIKTANEQESKSSENASIRPKTVARPPVFPSRPTGNSVKPSTKTPLTRTPIPNSNSETQFASTHSNQSSQVQKPSTAISVGSSSSTVSSRDEISNISVQTPKELATQYSSPRSDSPCYTKIFRSLSYPYSTRLQWTNYSKSTINSNITTT